MDYSQTLNYLDDLTRTGIKLGLENTQRLLEYFDHPELKVPTIHIAGTNGKGSTAAFTESILRADGFRTGLYTSPHLLDFRERIQVNREWISKERLADLAIRIREACTRLNLHATYFEVGTVMAFLHFFESGCQWNLMEVGLGGRLDSTNVCQAAVTIITSISHDHQEMLGRELSQIAGEKAAVIKPGGTVIAGFQYPEAESVIRAQAAQNGCPLQFLGSDFRATRKRWDSEGQSFDLEWGPERLEDLQIGLLGAHQVENAAVAVAACRRAGAVCGHPLDEAVIRRGLLETLWPGRLEVAGRAPWLVLDCAHNADSVKKLAVSIQEHFPFERCRVVLGVMGDKDLGQIVETIEKFSDHVILVRPRGERSADPSNLFKLFKISNKVIEIIEEIPYALHTAQKQSTPRDLILVTGSVFTVAEAKQSIEFQGIH